MKLKLSILAFITLNSIAGQAKEYLGYDLGNETLEGISKKLESQEIKYQLKYEKDKQKNDIKALPIIEINNHPLFMKYGKLQKGEFYFVGDKLSGIHINWYDIGDSLVDDVKNLVKAFGKKEKKNSLFKSFELAFNKKYMPQAYTKDIGVGLEAYYNDGNDYSIRLRRLRMAPTTNPLNDYYLTSVTYWNNASSEKYAEIKNNHNKIASIENLKNDPDVQFVKDF
jgi:hypothetical protein